MRSLYSLLFLCLSTTFSFGATIAPDVYSVLVRQLSFQDNHGQLIRQENSLTLLSSRIQAETLNLIHNHGFKSVTRNESGIRNIDRILEESKGEDYLEGKSVQAKQNGATKLLLVNIVSIECEKTLIAAAIFELLDLSTQVSRCRVFQKRIESWPSNINQEDLLHEAMNVLDDMLFDYADGRLVMTSIHKGEMTMYPTAGIGPIKQKRLHLYYGKEDNRDYYPSDYIGDVPGNKIKTEGSKYLVPLNKSIKVSPSSHIIGTLSNLNFSVIPIYLTYSTNTTGAFDREYLEILTKMAIGSQQRIILIEKENDSIQQEIRLQMEEKYLDGAIVTSNPVSPDGHLDISIIPNAKQLAVKILLKESDEKEILIPFSSFQDITQYSSRIKIFLESL